MKLFLDSRVLPAPIDTSISVSAWPELGFLSCLWTSDLWTRYFTRGVQKESYPVQLEGFQQAKSESQVEAKNCSGLLSWECVGHQAAMYHDHGKSATRKTWPRARLSLGLFALPRLSFGY
jgi:hypothetical protein